MNTKIIDKIDLGCGSNKKKGYTGIDILPLPNVDYVVNLEKGLDFLPDNSVSEFFSYHFFEHIDNIELMLSEIYRTLKPEGKCIIIVPHFSNPYYYSDYTHKRFFGLYSMNYLCDYNYRFKRGVPSYNSNLPFEISSVKLIFRSPRYKFINLFRKHIIERIFNLSPYFQEMYEGLFTNFFTCKEIEFILKKPKGESNTAQ